MNHPNVKFIDGEHAATIRSMLVIHADVIAKCVEHGATLDLATSDVVMYVENCNAEMETYLREKFPEGVHTGVMMDGKTACVYWRMSEAVTIFFRKTLALYTSNMEIMTVLPNVPYRWTMNKYLVKYLTQDGLSRYAEVEADNRADAIRKVSDRSQLIYCYPNVPGIRFAPFALTP